MPKKTPALEIPIKCLRVDDPLGMPIVLERLFAAPRLVHLQGVHPVGKTSFAFKVAFSLLEQNPDARILWVYFDDEIEYWRTAFEKLKPGASVTYLKTGTRSPSHFRLTLQKAMQADHYRLVIVDGLHYANLELAGWRRAQFLVLLQVQAKQSGLPILATDRQNYPTDREPEKYKGIDKTGHGECWRLHRPMYRNAALGQGDTFVIMPRELSGTVEEIGKRHYLP